MWKNLLFLPLVLFAQGELPPSMLQEAEALTKKYAQEIAKAPPPLPCPQTQKCLTTASVWFSIDLEEMAAPAFDTLNQEELWDRLRDLGVDGVYLKGLKKGGRFRTGLGVDPRWGESWNGLANLLQKRGMALIGESLGTSTGLGSDFYFALKNRGDYEGLYHLVEIEKGDWTLLPQTGEKKTIFNIPWLTLQELHKKGYVPEQSAPYIKESSWNATPIIRCEDGKVRRWIYLKENKLDPVLDWLNPSFAAARIATADTLDSIYNLGQKIVRFDGKLNATARETLSLWTRKLGGFSVQESSGGLAELKRASADLMTDILTRPALLHALIAQDAEALKLMYRLFLDEGIETKRLVHILQPYDEFTNDWAELICSPRKKYQYYDEILTGEALRSRLLREDILALSQKGKRAFSTWPGACAASVGENDFDRNRVAVTNAHLLLAFFYALQPGAFSFSVSDLLGVLSKPTNLDLMNPNASTLYSCLPMQLQTPNSFALRLKKILEVRKNNAFESSELIEVPQTMCPGTILLLQRQKCTGMFQLLAVNFSRNRVRERIERVGFRQTTAIDLMTGLADEKPLDSPLLQIDLPPLSGKVFLFQTKYFD